MGNRSGSWKPSSTCYTSAIGSRVREAEARAVEREAAARTSVGSMPVTCADAELARVAADRVAAETRASEAEVKRLEIGEAHRQRLAEELQATPKPPPFKPANAALDDALPWESSKDQPETPTEKK